MFIPWIDAIGDVYQARYEKLAGLVTVCMGEKMDKGGPLWEPLASFTPTRRALEAAMAYIYATAITYPYRQEDEAPEWVFEVEEIAPADYLDRDSDAAIVRFGRIMRAARTSPATQAPSTLAHYFNFTLPRDAVMGRIAQDYLANRASQEALVAASRGVWLLLGEEFHAHADLPQVVGGSAPEQEPVRAASAELARILWWAGVRKTRLAELFSVTRVTVDGWLSKR